MPDLSFEIVSAGPARDMITPAVSFEMRVVNQPAEQMIHAVLLRCQVQVEVARRPYTPQEKEQLRELFDDPSRWSDTLRPLTWINLSVNVPEFTGNTVYPLVIPCSSDFSTATAKYFHAIDGGHVPLTFLFSGSVFYRSEQGALQVAPISWNKEGRFRLAVDTWKAIMDLHHPDAVTLNVRRDIFDELRRLKARLGLASFDETIQHMIEMAERERTLS
jgi:hypothetical protein